MNWFFLVFFVVYICIAYIQNLAFFVVYLIFYMLLLLSSSLMIEITIPFIKIK